jgi:alpha-mannosidase
MITEPKIPRKLERIEQQYLALRFETVGTVDVEMATTTEYRREEPTDLEWQSASTGTRWGGNWQTAWFRGDAELPECCVGRKVFVRAKTNVETLFFVDGMARGVFDGNHPYRCLAMVGEAGHSYHLAFEAYAGHTFPGTQPYDSRPPIEDNAQTFGGIEIALEREDVTAFCFDLRVLRQLAQALDEHSLRRGRIMAGLAKVFELVPAAPNETPEAIWRPALAVARDIMKPLLDSPNGPTTPNFGVLGHSHIDTAWLWPLAETWRKCARTFSSMCNLMEQYPEVTFLQSAPCHTEVLRSEYPAIFAKVKELVEAGRWEPNGAMWVEPDCNLVSGESFVRQLLVGQRATREMFGYTSDTLWLPDVFGYSAALPQILQQAGVEFFVTTKIGWNDTTRFPFDTFEWFGMDGTSVVSHFNQIQGWPDPAELLNRWRWIQHKDSQDRFLYCYGWGDGGGGPTAEQMEVARRVRDLEGCPRTEHTTVTRFMQGVRDDMGSLPVYHGELYLEMHRGTLTSIAGIKRGNRKSELAMRDAEFLCSLAALRGVAYPRAELLEIWKRLLTNQFHDILPGSSIAEVNDEALSDFAAIVEEAQGLGCEALDAAGLCGDDEETVLLLNSLSWDRTDDIAIAGVPGKRPIDLPAQTITDVFGQETLVVGDVVVPALGGAIIRLEDGELADPSSPFVVAGDRVQTPFAEVEFGLEGEIVSFLDLASGRELVREDGALNCFLLGEDIPQMYDNWDIDEDQRRKLSASATFVSREVVADGELQLRLRSHYEFGASSLVQDIVFHANSPRVDFETLVDWHEKHQLLKVAFEFDVLSDFARHEIQYGFVERPTHRNYPQDRARFEVCAHKWTDLSETNFGVALLNDCKYGVDVLGGDLRLSLVKGGTHPDPRGDEGLHPMTYSLLPHNGPFSAKSVVLPAYELNVPPMACVGAPKAPDSLLRVDAPNVIVESVKWAEDEDALIVRLYEAEKSTTFAQLTFGIPVKTVAEVNLLEEEPEELALDGKCLSLQFRPFEIRTIKLTLA